jgi:LPS-assembly protein
MGRRHSPASPPARSLLKKAAAIGLLVFGAASALTTAFDVPAFAQTMNERLARRAGEPASAKPGERDRMLVDAAEMVFDRNRDALEARGDVQLFYQGRVLQADKVIYDRRTKRVYAEGRVKITERDGTITYADRAELTDDFKTGFVDSLRLETSEKTYFSSPRVERNEGETTVFNYGTYTACESCKDNPEKPPFWRVRAKRIIHQNNEQMVYFEDAMLEIWGQPIAWLPYFSLPDPSVTRKSGFLTPSYVARSNLGVGASVPYFWAIAPNMDLTLSPTVLSKQGLLGDIEWRHRLVNGSYSIRGVGIFQAEPGVFQPSPFGPGPRNFRGSLESKGEFFINERWKLGWDGKIYSDKWFQQDYRLPSSQLASNYFRESISTVYLNGQGEKGYFDLRGYYFQGLSRADIQAQQPVVGPVLDYNKRVNLPPALTYGIGGQLQIDFNFTNISRELASFEAIGGRRLDAAYGLFDVCPRDGAGNINRATCLLRGLGGNYARATLNVEWKRKFIDPIGQVWTPFAFAHVNGSWLSMNQSASQTFASAGGVETFRNTDQANFFNNTSDTFRGQAAPGAGIEYRYPFLANTSLAWHVFEPIAQVIVRPNESRNFLRVNEDSQSLVFDDSNLFDATKFSGYDRFEGGTRANYGFQYTATFKQGGYFNAMIGQSMQLAGRNSYATPDAANIGLQSGLERTRSDIVGRLAYSPGPMFAFVAKTRFDPETKEMRRLDLLANMNFGRFETSLQYARYTQQPLIGYDQRREGLAAGAKYKLTEAVQINGNVIFDLSRHLYNGTTNAAVRPAPLFSIAGLGVGATYTDDCTTLGVQYTSVLQANGAGQAVRNQTLLVSLQLRTVGDTRVRSALGELPVQDGLGGGHIR